MKVILYMAISLNGMIAKSNDDTSWVSKEEWDSYSLAVRTAKHLIVGHRTYNILTKQPEFAEFKDVKLIVVSKSNFKTVSNKHIIASSPQEALKLCKDANKVIVPVRDKHAPIWRMKGVHRKQLARKGLPKKYRFRVAAEANNSAVKRRFSSVLRGRTFWQQARDLYGKYLAYNLTRDCISQIRNFLQSRILRKV